LYVEMLFKQGFRYSEEFHKILQVRRVGFLPTLRKTCHPVQTLICPQFQSFGQRAIPSGRLTDQASFVRTTWISFRTLHCIEELLFQLASVRMTSSDQSASYFLSKFK
jgi:hypothetical protein